MQNNIAIKYGIIAGVGVVAYFLLFYLTNVKLFFNPIVNWGVLVVYLVGMVKACAGQRKHQHNFPFKDALRTAFLTFAITSLIFYVFNYLLFNFLDPNLAEVQKEILVEQMGKMAGRLQLSELKNQIEEFAKQDFRITIRNTMMSLAQSLIGGFVLSLAVAGLMKR